MNSTSDGGAIRYEGGVLGHEDPIDHSVHLASELEKARGGLADGQPRGLADGLAAAHCLTGLWREDGPGLIQLHEPVEVALGEQGREGLDDLLGGVPGHAGGEASAGAYCGRGPPHTVLRVVGLRNEQP
jgi:hypothetical protein